MISMYITKIPFHLPEKIPHHALDFVAGCCDRAGLRLSRLLSGTFAGRRKGCHPESFHVRWRGKCNSGSRSGKGHQPNGSVHHCRKNDGNNLTYPETLCALYFSFGRFLRSKMSSSAPSQTYSQRPPNRACPVTRKAPALNFFSQKPSELPRPAAKRTTKKSPEQFAMNYSGLFFFTQGLLSTLL